MKNILKEFWIGILATLTLAVVVSGIYPVVVFGLGQLLFPHKANGSLIRAADGTVLGSELLGQNFSARQYFHPRPSAAGTAGYDAAGSSGSNLGPTSQKLIDQVKERISTYRQENGLSETAPIPADGVTASGSGLDRHISIQNAKIQAPRVARERKLSQETVLGLIDKYTDGANLGGLLGDAGVNVLTLNLALDAASAPATR